ncbi:MAG TPA: hypothetical protein VFF71_06025 [Luteimonas sp.]|nr:hypothetical protein [Luteimonas sp.]
MTFSSADLIEALWCRRRRSLRPGRAPGEFPPGWTAWFDALKVRVGAVTGATAGAFIAIFMAREPKLPPRATATLDRWRAFNTLWRQQWHPASEDERGLRVLAMAITLLAHLFFALFLAYLAYVRIMAIPEQGEASAGEEVIQVEFIGEGTPEDEGGGPPQGEAVAEETPAAAAQGEDRTPQPAAPMPPQPQPEQQVATQPTPPQITRPEPERPTLSPQVPEPVVELPPVQQPLQVTETPQPDTTFTMPPVRMAEVPLRDVRVPELAAPAPAIEVVEVPAPVTAPQPREVATPAASVELPRQEAEVAVREIPAPLSPVEVPRTPAPPIAAPDLRPAQAPSVATRSIPAPRPAASGTAPSAQPDEGETGAATKPSSSSQAGTAAQERPSSGRESASQGTRPSATAAGSGTSPVPDPGALPSPKPGDDWGMSDRNRPGGQAGTSGLFNADGSPKLASGDGKVGGGLPPGTITEDFEKIDRNGTWLKRPPIDYTPTAFDKFWVPNETLLQEWVRRSIKEVLIPIPGTSKTIKCSVVLLALGGACDITDPNLQDVEAEAREPPDVPFKPELQENQGALGKPPGSQ